MRRDVTHSEAELKRADRNADEIFAKLNAVLDEAKQAVAELEAVCADKEAGSGG